MYNLSPFRKIRNRLKPKHFEDIQICGYSHLKSRKLSHMHIYWWFPTLPYTMGEAHKLVGRRILKPTADTVTLILGKAFKAKSICNKEWYFNYKKFS